MGKKNDKSGIGNRPFYYSDIYVDPQNENRLYYYLLYVNVSDDGGKTFKELMPAYGAFPMVFIPIIMLGGYILRMVLL